MGRHFWGMHTEEARRNRDIESFIASGRFEIDEAWGLEQLAEYSNEIALLQAGAQYSDLGIGRRRASSIPGIITYKNGLPTMVSDPDLLANSQYTPPGSIAHLKLQGVMRSQDGASSRGITSLLADFHAAYQNDNIDGILLEVNTGGGESLAGTILQATIAESPKAVVAWAHFMASAGVRATAPADEIIASTPGSEIGSIGTFITLSKMFASWYNSYYEDMYASKSTNKNRDFREYMKGNKEPMQKAIDTHNEYFLDEMKRYRPLKRDVEHTLSGAMFYAAEAKSRGLVDGIGSLTYAVSRLQANVKRRKKMTT